MPACKECQEYFDNPAENLCPCCLRTTLFAAFAKSCGLTRFPDPTGERYVYNADGSCDGKKSECTGFIDDLWAALVKAKGGDKSLIP